MSLPSEKLDLLRACAVIARVNDRVGPQLPGTIGDVKVLMDASRAANEPETGPVDVRKKSPFDSRTPAEFARLRSIVDATGASAKSSIYSTFMIVFAAALIAAILVVMAILLLPFLGQPAAGKFSAADAAPAFFVAAVLIGAILGWGVTAALGYAGRKAQAQFGLAPLTPEPGDDVLLRKLTVYWPYAGIGTFLGFAAMGGALMVLA